MVWSNYNDLTRPRPKRWFSKGNPLISRKSRLVKNNNLTRMFNKPSIRVQLGLLASQGHALSKWMLQMDKGRDALNSAKDMFVSGGKKHRAPQGNLKNRRCMMFEVIDAGTWPKSLPNIRKLSKVDGILFSEGAVMGFYISKLHVPTCWPTPTKNVELRNDELLFTCRIWRALGWWIKHDHIVHVSNEKTLVV